MFYGFPYRNTKLTVETLLVVKNRFGFYDAKPVMLPTPLAKYMRIPILQGGYAELELVPRSDPPTYVNRKRKKTS